ncbi:MAG TPA: S9 family peptidase [Bryobacteraceae bacterium]|nr:S9 family peptidase [Bryobacteraceae bacterium]
MKRILIACVSAAALAQTPSQWTPELSMKVKNVADVIPSPSGRMVAWTESHAVMDGEKSEMNVQVFLAHSDGSHRLQLTRGEKSSRSPAFTHDEQYIVFASERSGKNNLYRIPVAGGESEPLTDWKGTLGAYQLSPNGKWIAFTAAPDRPDVEAARREKRDFRVVDENPANQSLYVIPFEADLKGLRPVRRLVTGPYNIGGLQWSPDARAIAFETRPTPNADDGRKSDVLEVDFESGTVRAIAATPGTEGEPRYSPDGRYLAFVHAANTRLSPSHIVLYTRATSAARELPATADENPNLVGWAGDSKRILFTEPKGTRTVLYAMPVDGPPTAVFVPKGTFGFGTRLNERGTFVGLALQTPSEPVEAYALDLAGNNPVQVSRANTDLSKPPVGETKVIRWKAKDGKEIEGLLTYPVGYEKGKKYPMILNIHGGPAGGFNESFIGSGNPYPIAAFASRGYAVLRTNPRGSTGYGNAFKDANVNDWGGGDYQDIMAGVDHVIAMGVADPDRLAVMGWSYGGYMTNWVITQTNRFKCAATGAGLSDMISMWGTNDIPSTLDDYFTGPFYEQTDRYVKMSPLYHVKNVTTPTLFLHGAADIRVPTSQGYEMYTALKRKGVETKMVVYPRTPHGPQEPKFILDIMQRHLDWVDKHIGSTAMKAD